MIDERPDISGLSVVLDLLRGRPVAHDSSLTPLANDDLGRTHGPFADPHGDVVIVHSTRGNDDHSLYEFPLDGGPMRKIEIDGVDHPMHGTRSRNGVLTFDVLESTRRRAALLVGP